MSERIAEQKTARTKRLIRDTLTEQMEEKGFEGVTVRDIADQAKINRGTFYLHYRDKYDLLEQSEDEIIEGIKQIVKEIKPQDAIAYTSQGEPFPIILRLFEFFKENAGFMRVVLGPKGDAAFQVKLKEIIKQTFLQKIAKVIGNKDMLVPEEFLISYVSSAHVGVIQHWLETGMKQTPQEMTLILAKMTLLGPGYVTGLKK